MDIISNRGGFLKKETIADVIRKCIIELSSNSKHKADNKPKNKKNSKKDSFLISSITRLTINGSIEKLSNKGRKLKPKSANKKYKIIEDERDAAITGGYGTVSGHYGMAPQAKYVNYNSIFSHLGNFKSRSMYEDLNEQFEGIAKNGAESTREMVSSETIEKIAKHFKYFVRGEILGDIGFVPPVGLGIDSKDWEKYRLMSMMSVYQPLVKLKMSIA